MSYSFRGTTFAVVMENMVVDEWFAAQTQRTIDPVLAGTVRYVDIGGVAIPPMSLVMQFRNTTDRTTMQGYRGSTGTLIDDNGRSCTALLADFTPVRVKTVSSGYYRLAVVFEFVS